MNRCWYIFLIFLFKLEFLIGIKFWSVQYKNTSNPPILLLRHKGCIENFNSLSWRNVIWWKNPPKYGRYWYRTAQAVFHPIGRRQTALPHFFGGSFSKKREPFAHTQPVFRRNRRIGGIFLYLAAQNFELGEKKIRDQNLKFNTYSGWWPNPKPFQW